MPVPMLLPSKASGRAWGTLRHGFYDSEKRTIDTGNGEIGVNTTEGAIISGDCFVVKVPGAPGPGNEKPENGKLLDHGRLYKNSLNQLALAGKGLPATSWLYVAKGIHGDNPPEIWLIILLGGWHDFGNYSVGRGLKAVRFGVFNAKPEEYMIRIEGGEENLPIYYGNYRIDDISEDGSIATFSGASYSSSDRMYRVTDAFSLRLSGSGASMQATGERVPDAEINKPEEISNDGTKSWEAEGAAVGYIVGLEQ